jgi:hypothetical protein
MSHFFEHAFAHFFNHVFDAQEHTRCSGLPIGLLVRDGHVTTSWLYLTVESLEASTFILGVPGSGKTKLVKHLIAEAVRRYFGLHLLIAHPDLLPFFLATVASEERQCGRDLSGRTPIINLPDRQFAAGMNLLEAVDEHELFILAAEFSEAMRVIHGLDALGVRIVELLRNSVYALAQTGYTIAELRLFLQNPVFRASVLRNVRNSEVRSYYETHFDRLSAAEQSMYSAAVLNKTSGLTSDPLIAEVIGQRRSAVSLTHALDHQLWLAFVADKAVLREQAASLLALYFIRLKNAMFTRRRKGLSLVIADEAQNLLVHDSGLDIVLSECRKTHTGLITANQTLEQLTPAVRAALFGTGTQAFFRLSPPDADKAASLLGGGKHLAERLKSLPQRRAIVRTADQRLQEIEVPRVDEPAIDTTSFYSRCAQRWARPRADVAAEILQRHAQFTRTTSALDTWE